MRDHVTRIDLTEAEEPLPAFERGSTNTLYVYGVRVVLLRTTRSLPQRSA